MKKMILTLAVIVSALSVQVSAQGGISVRDLNIAQRGEQVEITFELDAASMRRGQSATFVPVLVTGDARTELPAITVEGKGAAVAAKRRGLESADSVPAFRAGSPAKYSVELPFDLFDNGSVLMLEGTSCVCGVEGTLEPVVLAENFVEAGRIFREPVYYVRELTAGEEMEEKFSFVANIDEFEAMAHVDRDEYINSNWDRSLTIYFHQGKSGIDSDFRNNAKTLGDITEAIKTIQASENAKISHIVLAGYASPEGAVQLNQKLGYDRAVSLRSYIVKNTGVDASLIDIHNGGVDWLGLRAAVEESDMPGRQEVLDIIDNVPIWDPKVGKGRHGTLMRLNGGRTYNYMMKNIFPDLRNATYIRIYYENVR